jgi:D-alanyl-D-alanine dipeptidase
MKQVIVWMIVAGCAYRSSLNAGILENRHARQCVLVTTGSWSSPNGTMAIFERAMLDSNWRQRGSMIPVVVGSAGLAWGHGVAAGNNDPLKKEGDHKAPAGIFVLHSVFGYAPRAKTKMRYLALSPNIVGVDDPQSRYYNQLIDKSKIEKPDWRTAEEMFRKDDLYKWGVVVDHNVRAKPGAGSCIFLHIWKNSVTPTAGCTAMSEKNLVDLIRWLDPASAPLLVQLPRPVYDQLRNEWKLPKL